MLIAILITGLIFILIAFSLNETNAKYLLAGYNTLSDADKEKFNLKAFLPFYRKFHIVLGITIILFGFILSSLFKDKGGFFAIAIYPIGAYIYFTLKSKQFYTGSQPKSNRVGLIFLIVVFVFLVVMLFRI